MPAEYVNKFLFTGNAIKKFLLLTGKFLLFKTSKFKTWTFSESAGSIGFRPAVPAGKRFYD